MKWSWKLLRIAGVDVYVHATFLLLLAWVGMAAYGTSGNAEVVADAVLFILAVFAIVVLHELGHAVTARRFGIRTRDITLLPIGGVARMDRMPDKPTHELLVALAGPAVNVALAAVFYVLAEMVGAAPVTANLLGGSFLARLFWVNVSLAVFNLLPAFPMDGGRALRAFLATRMDNQRATEIAARLGQGMAFLLGALGVLGNPLLLFIALFVWIGASREAAATKLRGALEGIPVERAMVTDFRTLSPADPVELAAEHVLRSFQEDFPVVEDGRYVGVLSRADLLKALAQGAQGMSVAAVMQAGAATVSPGELLTAVLDRLQERPSLPVVSDGHLVGMLTLHHLAEYLMLQNPARKRQARAAA
jgi:Zn-dependent protease